MPLMSGHDGALPNPRGVKLTYDDFVLFPDDGLRHELIDGEHYVTPSPNTKHQQIVVTTPLAKDITVTQKVNFVMKGGKVFRNDSADKN